MFLRLITCHLRSLTFAKIFLEKIGGLLRERHRHLIGGTRVSRNRRAVEFICLNLASTKYQKGLKNDEQV